MYSRKSIFYTNKVVLTLLWFETATPRGWGEYTIKLFYPAVVRYRPESVYILQNYLCLFIAHPASTIRHISRLFVSFDRCRQHTAAAADAAALAEWAPGKYQISAYHIARATLLNTQARRRVSALGIYVPTRNLSLYVFTKTRCTRMSEQR